MASQVKLTPVKSTDGEGVIFVPKPERITRDYSAYYVASPVAMQDYSPSASGPGPSIWGRNNPEMIQIEGILVSEEFLANGGVTPSSSANKKDVEDIISKLEGFRFKNARTKEPPDLVFTVGSQHDRVRLDRMNLNPRLWTEDLRRQQVRYSITLLVIKPRGQ